uniref:Uncharacterized protein n=1 Tax=Glossina pallidipes TaxID=7398 RepID=A0A1B0ADC2_GLOPL
MTSIIFEEKEGKKSKVIYDDMRIKKREHYQGNVKTEKRKFKYEEKNKKLITFLTLLTISTTVYIDMHMGKHITVALTTRNRKLFASSREPIINIKENVARSLSPYRNDAGYGKPLTAFVQKDATNSIQIKDKPEFDPVHVSIKKCFLNSTCFNRWCKARSKRKHSRREGVLLTIAQKLVNVNEGLYVTTHVGRCLLM